MPNASNEDDSQTFSLSVTIPVGVFITSAIIVAIIGNSLTIISFFKDRNLRSVYNYFITNLAVTDLLVACVSMPFYAVYTLRTYTWPFGYHFCKAYMAIDFTLCLESVLMMITLSWDRLLLLKLGPHYNDNQTPKVVCIKILATWIIAFTLYTPAIIGWDIWTGEDTVEEGDCDVQFAKNIEFTMITALIEFAVPFLCITIINFFIYLNIRKRTVSRGKTAPFIAPSSSARNTGLGRSTKGPFMTNSSNSHVLGHRSNNTSVHTRAGHHIKAAKRLSVLIIVFVITWAPYTVATVIIAFCDSCVNKDWYEALNWVLWMKAALNPFLYAYSSERFKRNFKSLIPCCRLCKQKNNNKTTNLPVTEVTNE